MNWWNFGREDDIEEEDSVEVVEMSQRDPQALTTWELTVLNHSFIIFLFFFLRVDFLFS